MKMETNVRGMVFALVVVAPVMQIFMVLAVSMQFVPIVAVSMDFAIWKLIVVSVMKGGQVKKKH